MSSMVLAAPVWDNGDLANFPQRRQSSTATFTSGLQTPECLFHDGRLVCGTALTRENRLLSCPTRLGR